MPKLSIQKRYAENSDFDFPVSLVPLEANGKRTRFLGVQNGNTGEVYAPVTNRYGIITHGEIIKLVREVFERQNIEFIEEVVSLDRGARMIARYDFPRITRDIKNVGDIVGFRFSVHNALDGKWKAYGLGGTMRLVCSNGATSSSGEMEFAKKHNYGVTLEGIEDSLKFAMEKYEEETRIFTKLADIHVETDRGESLINNLVKEHVISNRLAKRVLPRWQNPTRTLDTPRNLWSLFNAITEEVKTVEDKHFEVAQNTTRRVLSRFSLFAN